MAPKIGKCYKSKWKNVTLKLMSKKTILQNFCIDLGDYFFPVFCGTL